MKREAAKRIIEAEHLIAYSFFEERADRSDEMVIKNEAGRWVVYATDERASRIAGGERAFDREEDALESFIRRLRALNRVICSILE